MARATTHANRVLELQRAERTLEEKLTDLKRLVTSIRFWQRRVKYYANELTKTDEQRTAERAARDTQRQQRAQRHRRIKL